MQAHAENIARANDIDISRDPFQCLYEEMHIPEGTLEQLSEFNEGLTRPSSSTTIVFTCGNLYAAVHLQPQFS